jgi:hypothetical protein
MLTGHVGHHTIVVKLAAWLPLSAAGHCVHPGLATSLACMLPLASRQVLAASSRNDRRCCIAW